ncbi:DUF4037 domain-containing protein [Paenibacillus sp. MMS20-IR301]|uniref:DUF4037 domain-containing protein n=1 Tax=Paenibacillus sp. MMS20-IR301 TaxID=2895946 RepID=UPI0028F018C7|nr:DUF4037 domain-containing protein [Paenibacillus sp. MMS20-IR301]WNS41998.1 DUF4037 domain-containing protein [Paenibacillus sp. MMS20-IR301]
MARPYVNLTSRNRIDAFQHEISSRLDSFAALEGVCGITLNGGLSRGYGDDLSEIDLVFYLNPSSYLLWSGGQSSLPLGITRIGDYLYDIKAVSLDEEEQKHWEGVALWDLSYAAILHDPSGRIAALIDAKLAAPPRRLQAEGPLFQCWWHFRLAGDIWIHRGDYVQGHAMLNLAAARLIEALFLANREYVPHEKWLIHLSRTLAWTPPDWEACLLGIMDTGDFSRQSLITRQAAIERIWEEVDAYIISMERPEYNLNVMHVTFYDLLKLLVEEERPLPVHEWTKRMSLSVLSGEPFIRFTSVQQDYIITDKEKLLGLNPEDLYSWHAAIVKQLSIEIRQHRAL